MSSGLEPWSSFGDHELVDSDEPSYTTSRSWGSSGYNDTGWVDLVASGADPSNQTYAYGDMFLDFARSVREEQYAEPVML